MLSAPRGRRSGTARPGTAGSRCRRPRRCRRRAATRRMPSSRQRAASFTIASAQRRWISVARRSRAARAGRRAARRPTRPRRPSCPLRRTGRSPCLAFRPRRPVGEHAPERRRRLSAARRTPSTASRPTCPPTSSPTSSSSVIGPDREAEVEHRLVDRVDRDALVEHAPGLVHVRRRGCGWRRSPARRSRRSPSCPAAGRTRPPSRSPPARVRGVTITSSSGILCTGEKKCMPSTRSGRGDAVGDLRDRDRARVASRRSPSAGSTASTSVEHLVLEREILEHRLDHERHAGRSRSSRSCPRTSEQLVVELLARDLLLREALLQHAAHGREPAAHLLERRCP